MGKFGKMAAAAALLLAGSSAMAQQAPATIGGHPNLNGIWQSMSG